MFFCNLFVYGTLMDPETRADVLGRNAPYSEPDTLSGFRADEVIIEGLTYPALYADTSSMVHGAIVVIHEDELRVLDEYETDVYERRMVTLMSGKVAWTFIRKEQPEPKVDNEVDRRLYDVLRGLSRKEGVNVALPENYLPALSTIGLVDQDTITDLGRSVLSHLWTKFNSW